MSSNLLRCGLCDTIRVIFPDFNGSGDFKIVRTVWNVLENRYEEMELGNLSVSLSEALGISDIQKDSRSTIEQIIDHIDDIDTALTVTAPSVSITASKGTLVAAYARRYGNVVQLLVQIRNTSSTASGADIFTGTLNTTALRPGGIQATGATYYGAHALVGYLNAGGGIGIRNASSTAVTIPSGNTANIVFTYIVS